MLLASDDASATVVRYRRFIFEKVDAKYTLGK